MKNKSWKKYLPVIALLLFVALVIIALIIAQGVSRRAPVAPTAPEKPKAGACLVEFETTCVSTFEVTEPGATPTPTPTPSPSPSPTATPSATPSPSPSATPTPTPTASPTLQGGFFIRKYQDTNGNGKQESGEQGLTWKFQWSKDNGSNWNDYETDGTKLGEGGVVYLPVGTNVKIREVAVSGWTSTTPTSVDVTIKANDNQLMVFGNWQPVSATATPAPKCNSACLTNSDCPTSMNCVSGSCRNPSCASNTNCVCAVTVAATPTPAPEQLPKSGVIDDTLKLVGAGVGAIILGLIALMAL